MCCILWFALTGLEKIHIHEIILGQITKMMHTTLNSDLKGNYGFSAFSQNESSNSLFLDKNNTIKKEKNNNNKSFLYEIVLIYNLLCFFISTAGK